jgi:NADH-quinone oxidoreductase subunit M
MLKTTPKLGWIFGFCAMASLGLPGLAGFWGEFPAILSAYQPAPVLSEELFRTLMVIAALGTVLAAGYLLWLFQRTAMGEPKVHVAHSVGAAANDHHDDADAVPDVNIYEWVAWVPFLVGILVLGIAPNLLFKMTNPAVEVGVALATRGFGG